MSKIYVIKCAQGLNRDICPYISQSNLCCVECSNARYFPREKQIKPKEENLEENLKDGE